MHDHDNPPLTPEQQRIEQLTETVTAFVGLNPKVDVAKVRRFLRAIRTGDPAIDREVRANAEVIVTFALARGSVLGGRSDCGRNGRNTHAGTPSDQGSRLFLSDWSDA